jgi:hypothetical protein
MIPSTRSGVSAQFELSFFFNGLRFLPPNTALKARQQFIPLIIRTHREKGEVLAGS